MTSTDSNGKIFTVTAVVHHASGTTAADGGSGGGDKSFFSNSGAVAGVFVALGLFVTSAALAAYFLLYKRRRRQKRLDRDVFAAASRSGSSQRLADDEKSPSNRSTYMGGYSGDLNQAPQQTIQNYGYEDPSGGFDSYTIPGIGDRSSTVTAAGFAGFGAQAAQVAYQTHAEPYNPDAAYDYAAYREGYEEVVAAPQDERVSAGSGSGYNAVTTDQQASAGGYYFDPRQAGEFYEDRGEELQHPMRSHQRSGSEGSVTKDVGIDRGLTVTNV